MLREMSLAFLMETHTASYDAVTLIIAPRVKGQSVLEDRYKTLERGAFSALQ
jgi:hypothetical protein